LGGQGRDCQSLASNKVKSPSKVSPTLELIDPGRGAVVIHPAYIDVILPGKYNVIK